MRSTRRSLLIAGGFAVVGTVMSVTGAVLREAQGETVLAFALVFIGLAIAPIAWFQFIGSLISGRRKEALEAGTGEIGRWKLSAAEWSAFRAQEQRLVASGRPANMLNLRPGTPQAGDVRFGRKGVIADEDFHDLTPGGLIDLRDVEFVPGSPSCLEFNMRAQKSRGASGTGFGFHYMTLRVPIAADDMREAMRVMDHYRRITRRGPAIAMINPRLTIGICLAVAGMCAIAAVWGLSNTQNDAFGDAPLYAAIIGLIAGAGALVLAAIVAFRVRTEPKG